MASRLAMSLIVALADTLTFTQPCEEFIGGEKTDADLPVLIDRLVKQTCRGPRLSSHAGAKPRCGAQYAPHPAAGSGFRCCLAAFVAAAGPAPQTAAASRSHGDVGRPSAGVLRPAASTASRPGSSRHAAISPMAALTSYGDPPGFRRRPRRGSARQTPSRALGSTAVWRSGPSGV